MIVQLFDFLGSLFDGLLLAAQAWVVGGVAFIVLLALPLGQTDLADHARKWVGKGALALIVAECLSLSAPVVSLVGRLDLSLWDALTADFALWHGFAAVSALILAVLALCPFGSAPLGKRHPWVMVLPLIALSIAAVMTSHAASRLDGRLLLGISHLTHVFAASVWVGGIPYLLLALQAETSATGMIVRRFSAIAATSVGLLTVAAVWLSLTHVNSLAGLVGGEYGALVLVKIALFGSLLLLGLGNLLAGRAIDSQGAAHNTAATQRIRVFAEVELGLACAVLLVAASLGGQPPPVDLPNDLVSPAEMLSRIIPQWPRLIDAPVITEATWSEVNHNMSGLVVFLMGTFALLNHTGKAPWARHWPLLLTAFAWIVIRTDRESWPLGDCSVLGCGGGDPEVIQHRLLTLLPVGFGILEWRVRMGKVTNPVLVRMFPLFCAVGGALLLTHSHQIGDTRSRYLVEFTHLPMGMFGIMAGWARWLELRAQGPVKRWAGWVWPICLMMVGLLLLDYREG